MKSFISARGFARLVKRDNKTIVNWIKKGYIPGAKRIGHYYAVPIEEIEVYRTSPEYPPRKWQK
jgi:hypothetical protein